MPTWTEKNGQDDITYNKASKNGDIYTFNVKTKDHKNEGGLYHSHVYAYDGEGMHTIKELTIQVPEADKPEIKDVNVTTPTRLGYKVTCTVESSIAITRAILPTWTEKNGQDDITYYEGKIESQGNNKYKISYEVETKNHKNESGKYISHIYAYNATGKYTIHEIENIQVPENKAPVIESAKIESVTRKKISVSAIVTDDLNVKNVSVAVWTEKNGQDDLHWYSMKNENGTYYGDIDMKNHSYETGGVHIHVYAFDDNGSHSIKELETMIPENQPPVISNIQITNISNDGYTISCNVSDDAEVHSVKMPTWTEENGQDDLNWYEAEIKDGVAKINVHIKNHNFEYGNYITHIYAWDNDGQVSSVVGGTINIKEPNNGVPIIKNVKISDANDDGYTVTCDVDFDSPIKEVLLPTWTYKNGQDDIVYYKATCVGGNKYSTRIERRRHNGEFGTYITHIYAFSWVGPQNHIELNYHNIVNTTVAKGWTYIKGEKFFFDNRGNMVGNMPCKKVIDVSSYQGVIDWDMVAKYGEVDGVIIRMLSHTNGAYKEDSYFARNLEACRRYNIPFGVYIYDYSHNSTEAYQEADLVMSILRKYNVSASELKYNIYFDLERKQSETGLNSQQMSDVAATFINRISNYGYKSYLYSYRSMLNTYLNTQYIWSQTNWFAAYTDTMGWSNPYYHGYFGWQYTSKGSIPGINGNCDISCWFTL